jgi:hypothetical protein
VKKKKKKKKKKKARLSWCAVVSDAVQVSAVKRRVLQSILHVVKRVECAPIGKKKKEKAGRRQCQGKKAAKDMQSDPLPISPSQVKSLAARSYSLLGAQLVAFMKSAGIDTIDEGQLICDGDVPELLNMLGFDEVKIQVTEVKDDRPSLMRNSHWGLKQSLAHQRRMRKAKKLVSVR